MEEELKYCIIESKDLHLVDFDEVLQTSVATLRFSLNKEKIIIKYRGDQPYFCFEMTNDSIGLPEYTQQEILRILDSPEWNNPN